MNKSALINEMSKTSGLSRKETEKALNAFMECVEASLIRGEKVQLVGFGTFDVKHKGSRPGRNPKKPEVEIMIPAATVPVFKPGKFLKDSINENSK